ncbi:MAG: EamA family transporter [Candidatus Gastranaerophilaceae bacterium]
MDKLSLVFTIILGILFLKETLTLPVILGVLFIISGVLILLYLA